MMGLELQHKDNAVKRKEIEEDIQKMKAELLDMRKQPLSAELIEAKSKFDAVGAAISELEAQLVTAQEKLEMLDKHAEDLTEKLLLVETDKASLTESIAKTRGEIEELKKGITELEQSAFGEFCKKWDLPSITQYEGADLVGVNELLEKKSQLLMKIEQLNARMELLRSEQMTEKLSRLENDVLNAGNALTDLIKKLSEERKRSDETEKEYQKLENEVAEIESKKGEVLQKQKQILEEMSIANEAIGDLKKELITSMCQVKSNIHMKLRTVDEMKLKNLNFLKA